MEEVLSIITTFYNAEQFIMSSLMSVIKQVKPTGAKIEYIIVDDHSPDKSREIVEKFIAQYKNQVKHINVKLVTPEKNLGCGGARRFGIEQSTGDYLMFLDADDYYINNDFCKRALETLKHHNADIVEYGMIMQKDDGSKSNITAAKQYVIDKNVAHNAEIALFRDNLIKFNVWTKIYKRSIAESYTYSDARTFEDVMTIPVWIANAKKIVIMPTLEINYRAAANSIIRADNIKTRLGTIGAIASHFERFKDDFSVLKAMYGRAMVDLNVLLNGHSSENAGFIEMSKLNTQMLKYIYPDSWQEKTWDIEEHLNELK